MEVIALQCHEKDNVAVIFAENVKKGTEVTVKDKKGNTCRMTVIDDIPFAAYDGRSVNINGSMVYLYRIDTEDESMKQIISQIKEDGTVYVEKDGQKQQYNGFVYQDYLLLYDRDTDMSAVVDVMNHYVPQTSPYYEEQ